MKLNSRGKERVFGPQLPRTGFWQVTLPLSVIHGYRKIPCKVRGAWSMGSSTSHLAETAVAAGGGWASFRRYSSGWKFLPTYAIGAGLRHARLSGPALRLMGVSQGHGIDMEWRTVQPTSVGMETHGWAKKPYPPLPFMGKPVNHWDGKPVSIGARGEPFTSPWYGRSSTQITYSDIAQVAHWLDGANPRPRPRGGIGYAQLLDRGRRGWGGDKPRPVWRTSVHSGWGGGSNWPSDISVIDRGWLASYAPVRSEGWGDPFKHVSMDNKELPDWFPTTRAAMPDGIPGWIAGRHIGTDWDTPRNTIGVYLLGGLLAGMLAGTNATWEKG